MVNRGIKDQVHHFMAGWHQYEPWFPHFVKFEIRNLNILQERRPIIIHDFLGL